MTDQTPDTASAADSASGPAVASGPDVPPDRLAISYKSPFFDGDKLLTTPNNNRNEDLAMFELLGLRSRPAFVDYPAGNDSSKQFGGGDAGSSGASSSQQQQQAA